MSFHHKRDVKRTRHARKCDWCWYSINQGDPSVATSGVVSGDFYNGRYHPECYDAIQRWCDEAGAWGEELPMGRMNRGGIELYGEEETP